MNNRIKLYFANFLVVAAGLWLTSCSASDDSLGSDKGADVAKNEKVLTLRINTGATSFGSRTTDITADPGTTAENTINRLTVGIFSADGNTVKYLKDLTAAGSTDKFTTNGSGAIANIVASSLATGDKVLVAVNAPANTFQGVTKETDFNAKTEKALAALTYTAAAEKDQLAEGNNNIPMYGIGTLSVSGKDFSASVNVKHLLAKVTLESLSVDFEKSGSYNAASFTPTKIFLINEPDALLFNNDAWETGGNLLHGFNNADTSHGTYAECLTTNTLAGKTSLTGDKTGAACKFADKYYFYTLPNISVPANGKNTKLVIAGTFKSNNTDGGATVYYPVALNAKYDDASSSYKAAEDNTDIYKVYPNRNYKCSVVIKMKGADNPFADLDPKKAAITVTVTGFQDVTQTTVFK